MQLILLHCDLCFHFLWDEFYLRFNFLFCLMLDYLIRNLQCFLRIYSCVRLMMGWFDYISRCNGMNSIKAFIIYW